MIDDANDKEPQILLVSDPSQIATLQVCIMFNICIIDLF